MHPTKVSVTTYAFANIERGILGLDLISAHTGGRPSQSPRIVPAASPGGAWRDPKSGQNFGLYKESGPVKVSACRGSVRNLMLYRTLCLTAFSRATRTQNMQKKYKNSNLGQNPGGCRPENPSLYQPLGAGLLVCPVEPCCRRKTCQQQTNSWRSSGVCSLRRQAKLP